MKKWTYRFKRGLASFLTVGMIASGVSGAVCMPVHATTAAAAYDEKDVEDGIRQIKEGLKKQISELFNEKIPTTKTKAEFQVVVNLKQTNNPDTNNELLRRINDDAGTIVKNLTEECPSELFWCDGLHNCNNAKNEWKGGEKFSATYTLELKVKDGYRAEENKGEAASISVPKIRDAKNAMSDGELDKVIDGIVYNGLKEEISKTVNGKYPDKEEAGFAVIVDNNNEDIANALNERVKKRASEIVSRLSRECASDFFWFDKDSKDLPFNIVTGVDGEHKSWLTFYLAVKQQYKPTNGGTYSLDLNKIQTTKENIDKILKNEAGASDYTILCKYRDTLINDKNIKKDPNQLAQAFQWLCDQTVFTHGTECYTVTGTVGGKERMWNIVKTEAKSYLVDLANYTAANNWGFFLAGVQANGAGSYRVGETVYVPKNPDGFPELEGLKYKQLQSDFKFVPDPGQTGIVAVVGQPDILIKVEGNKGNVEFYPKAGQSSVASVIDLGNNQAQIHIIGPGSVTINAIAGETDSYGPRRITFPLTVKAANGGSTEVPPTVDPENPGSGGGGGAIGGGGGAIGGGSSSSISGSVGADSTRFIELLAQTDFGFEVGHAKVIKTLGAADFTITATGQVAGSEITYKSSDPAVATVDAKTGTVHIVGEGEAKIIATASETDIHKEAESQYKLEVIKEAGNIYY